MTWWQWRNSNSHWNTQSMYTLEIDMGHRPPQKMMVGNIFERRWSHKYDGSLLSGFLLNFSACSGVSVRFFVNPSFGTHSSISLWQLSIRSEEVMGCATSSEKSFNQLTKPSSTISNRPKKVCSVTSKFAYVQMDSFHRKVRKQR